MAPNSDERVRVVTIDESTLSVSLADGRTITVPLAWYPRLLNASMEERRNFRVSAGGNGIHWPGIDEDLSTEGLLRGGEVTLELSPKNRKRWIWPLFGLPCRNHRTSFIKNRRHVLSGLSLYGALPENASMEAGTPSTPAAQCPTAPGLTGNGISTLFSHIPELSP